MDIDTSDTHLFNPTEWIGVGKKYKDVPSYVADARTEATAIPSSIGGMLPQKDESILNFVRWALPSQSSGFNIFPMHAWFSSKEPDIVNHQEILKRIMRRTIPSRDIIDDLEMEFGQQWFDGKRSITDPRYNRGRDRYPVWVLAVWKEISSLISKQKIWREAYACVAQEIKGGASQEYPDIERFLGSRGWDSDVKHGGYTFSNYTFAPLLCKQPLYDDVTQAMISVLQQRLEKHQEEYPHHVIAASRFYNVLHLAADKKRVKKKKPASLQVIEDRVHCDPETVLWFPVLHLGHEVAVCVDFRSQEIRYGDTIPTYSAPSKLIRDLQAWLKSAFGHTFVNKGNALEHGVQADAISCIPGTMNTISHGIFGDVLWTPDDRFLDRMKWFQILVPEPATMSNGCGPVAPLGSPQIQEPSFSSSVTPSIARTQPSLQNLLNPLDDALAFADIADFTSDTASDDEVPDIPTTQVLELQEDRGQQGNADISVERVEESAYRDDQKKAWQNLFNQKRQEVTLKRARHLSPDQNHGSGERCAAPENAVKRARSANSGGPIGLSRSAKSEREARRAADGGQWDHDERREWQEAILQIDPKAEFYEDTPRAVRCSNCGNPRKVKTKNDTRRFRQHYLECVEKKWNKKKSNVHVARTSTLTSSTYQQLLSYSLSCPVPTHAASLAKRCPLPCPGLSAAQDEKIPIYLRRTSVLGGGARSVTVIAQALFSKPFSKLSSHQKDDVLDTQRHEQAWNNDHQKLRIFSSDCTNIAHSSDNDKTKPCHSCRGLLKNPRFYSAINRPTPNEINYKYVNYRFRNRLLGEQFARIQGLKNLMDSANDKQSPFIKFAEGAIAGKYNNNEVFVGLVHAMVQKVDKEERGVGMQNFCYTPAWDEFVHIVALHSPRTHKFLSQHFPARTRRSLRLKEGREPSIPLSICADTFLRAKEYCEALDYSGPIGLGCDETKLQSGLHLYWNTCDGAHYLVGGVNGPIRVIDAERVDSVMSDQNIVLGTKIHLWVIQIPLPGMRPAVLAAIPVSSLKAPELLEFHDNIISGLLDVNLHVISYSCDGTETERLVQHRFVNKAPQHIAIDIDSPKPYLPSLHISIPVYQGRPIAVVQDSKHGLKTARNNLFSGASLLVLGNYIAHYEHIRNIAFKEGSPLYHRDVEKLDRQDDNAAARLFSSATLQFLEDQEPMELGLIVFLFVFGELIDAYQNRQIDHSERIKMVLRARYFVDMWESFVVAIPAYKKARYFLSREFIDIISLLVNGLISLIIIHRDFVPEIFPLLPWLHSTEACEHLFGMARQIVQDFTMMDFINMLPKLAVKVREATLRGRQASPSDMKAQAAGYNHTYLDTHDVDLMALASFPSAIRIQGLAAEAADEASSLIALLGILPDSLVAGGNSGNSGPLPPITSWVLDTSDKQVTAESGSDSESDSEDLVQDNGSISAVTRAISQYQNGNDFQRLDSIQIESADQLTNAAIAISVEEQIGLYACC
ncbi:hypothetical protein AX14_003566 [Amanita brunnescens Koide BX004]|nr:hypothetical protein AX14_003566 [Amanita brunnescens Koide BX004]